MRQAKLRPEMRARSSPRLYRTQARCSGRPRRPAERGRRRSTASRARGLHHEVGWLFCSSLLSSSWSSSVSKLSPASMCHRGGRTQKLAIPGNGAVKAGLEREPRSPVEHGARALGAQKLMANFVANLVEHFRTQRGLHLPQDQFNHFEYADLALIGKIKSLAAEGGI